VPGGVGVTLGGESLGDLPERVERISISRGRQDEFDRTGTGTCTISLNWRGGSITDFTGADGTVTLTNPFGGTETVFSGVVDEVAYDLVPSQVITRVEVTLVDALDFLAGIELAPGVNGILPLPAAVDAGNIFYEQQIPQDRIDTAILESGWGGGTEIFTGNVQVRDTVYAPRTSLLTVIQDAADAEFPGVANFFVQQDGTLTFHGRLARFNPSDPQYSIDTYTAGDGAACQAAGSSMARIHRCRLGSSRQRIYNAALATPQGILDDDIENQVVTDAGSIATYGLRSWSAENLLTYYDELNGPLAGGDPYQEALAATLQFAQYYVDNYASPQNRIEELTFITRDPAWANAEATWAVLCNADISDIVTLTVTNPGIGISATDYFVEGVRMDIEPLHGDFPLVRKTLNLSPRAYWDNDF
jgi:hypothetical protein